MNVPSITVEIDVDRDGTWAADVSSRLGSVAAGSISIRRGMNRDGSVRVGELTLRLNNDDGAFTPEYTSATYYGKFDDPGVPVRVTMTHTFESVSYEYTLFTGYTADLRIRAGIPGQNVAEIRALEVWEWIARGPGVSLDVATSRTTGTAIEAGLAALGIASSLYDCDAGLQALPYHYEGKTPAGQFFQALVASELGGNGFVTGNGKVRFESRSSRLGLSQYRREVLKDNPLGYWRMDEATGTVAYDYGSLANNGAYNNSPTLRQATLLPSGDGASVSFVAASSQYVSIPDNAAYETDYLTVTGFFAPKTTSNAWGPNRRSAANVGGFSVQGLKVGGTPIFYVYISGDTWRGVSVAVTLVADRAYWFCGRYDGATLKFLIVDLVTGTSYSNSAARAGVQNVPASPTFRVARSEGSSYYGGKFQDIAYFGEALSDARVNAHYLAARLGLWGDGSDVAPAEPPVYERSLDELVSKVTARGRVYREGQTITIWEDHAARNPFDPTADATLALAPGEVYVDEIVIPGAIVTLVTPAANLDYRANTAADRSGTDRTSSLTVTMTTLGGGAVRRKLQNEHASDTIYVTEFRLRAAPLESLYDETATVVESAIAAQPAGQEITLDIPWVGGPGSLLRDFAFQLRETYDLPFPWVTVDLAWQNDETVATCGWLETGTLVKFVDKESGAWGTYVDDWWYVAGIEHDIALQGSGQQPYRTRVSLYPSRLHRLADQVLYDDFDREDISGGLGVSRSDDDWAGDTWLDVESGVAKPNTGTASIATVDLGALAFDQALALQMSGMSGSAIAGLVARYIDANNYLRCVFDRAAAEVQLIKVVSGTPTELVAVAWTAAATGTLHWFVQGNRLRVYVDRKLKIDTTDAANNTGTKVGLFHSGAADDAAFERAYAGRL